MLTISPAGLGNVNARSMSRWSADPVIMRDMDRALTKNPTTADTCTMRHFDGPFNVDRTYSQATRSWSGSWAPDHGGHRGPPPGRSVAITPAGGVREIGTLPAGRGHPGSATTGK